MANNNAIVSIIEKLTEKNHSSPCKKTLQKIVFLVEAKCVDLGFDYGIHFYGPYSSDLDFAVRELCDKDILEIKYTSTNHFISVKNHSGVGEYSNKTVDEVIDLFGKEAPNELELIATALYVYLRLKDRSKVMAGVIKLKGNKFPEDRIVTAIKKLEKGGYIAA